MQLWIQISRVANQIWRRTQGEFYQVIVAATREKVRQNSDVQKVLLATGDLSLKPDHHQETNAPAAWHYFDILMQIRTELQQGGKL